MSEMDEIWALFADDGSQSLDAMEECLMALQNGDEDPAPHIAALFRAVHTFKGNSRVLGLGVVESRAHVAEDLIGLVRDEGVALNKEILDLLFYAGDTLRTMLEHVAATHQDVDPVESQDLQDQLVAAVSKYGGKDAHDPMAEMIAPEAADTTAPEEDVVEEAEAAMELPPEPDQDDQHDADVAIDETPEEEIAEEEVSEASDEEIAQIDESELYEDKVQMNMALDPVYQNIFTGMANETIDQLTGLIGNDALALDELVKKASNKASSLSYAASQLALTNWTMELEAFDTRIKVAGNLDVPIMTGMIQDLVTALKALLANGFGGVQEEFVEEDVVEEVAAEGDGAIEPTVQVKKKVKRVTAQRSAIPDDRYATIFDLIDTCYTRISSGDVPSKTDMQALADRVEKFCDVLGFTRAADIASRLNTCEDVEKFRATQLKFFEEIASIEDLLPDEDLDNTKMPSELLGEWCADNIDDTLDQILETLNAFVKEKEHAPLFRRYDRLMRQAYHTCAYYKMATGVHLALALVDLFSRAWQSGSSPAAMILRLSFSFVDKTRPIFKKSYRNEDVDLDPLDRLFEEALTAIYAQNGTVSAKTVEKRLGLPEVFRNILSPESVSSAMTAIQHRMNFYILRTDIQNDEVVAKAFFEFLKEPNLRMITNVTIFDEDNVLFDFLVATMRDETDLAARLAEIDETGEVLSIQRRLNVKEDPDNPDQDQTLAHSAEYEANEEVMRSTLAMVEAIGEISAGQAMVQHMLGALTARDLMLDIDAAFREHGLVNLDPAVRAAVRSCVDNYTEQLKSAAEAEMQLTEKLAQLQQESVAVRSRSADHLLRQLSFFVVTESRKRGAVARTFTVGADVILDQMVMENLRKMIEPVLAMRMEKEPIPSEYHISIQSEGDRATIVIEDDGSAAVDAVQLKTMQDHIDKEGGELRLVTLPERGVRFYLTMPLHMIVLDGMVVRVGDVNYVIPIDSILRIQQSDQSSVLDVSAKSGTAMLEVGAQNHVPIHALPGAQVSNVDAAPQTGAATTMRARTKNKLRTFVIVRNENYQMAIPVDELMGQQLVLLRPLRGVMTRIKDLSGVALLAGGEVGMVLAVNRLLAA